MQVRGAIARDEGIMLGKPTVAGTRLTVELILEKLAAGEGQILESHPRLDRECVREALLFAARLSPSLPRTDPPYLRMPGWRTFLRSLMDFGVISTSSSSPMYSRASSRVILRTGVRFRASSAPAERTLVSFLFLHTLTLRSFSRLFAPTTMPT